MDLVKVLYTAEASVTGGRNGHVRSADGQLDLDLAVPEQMGGNERVGTNPEQLFAAGYAACFQSALSSVAAGRPEPKPDLNSSELHARVGIGQTGHGGFGLTVELDLSAPGVPPAETAALMARAHQICPYSNATRGNVEVTLKVDGVPVDSLRGESDAS